MGFAHEYDRHDCESHDGLALFNTLICSFNRGFGFDDACLLLFE